MLSSDFTNQLACFLHAEPHDVESPGLGLLLTLCVVLFLDGLDVSMIGVALPSIGAELDLSTSTLQWLVSGYVLGYGGLLLLGGRTADLLGRRRVFLVALAVFALASLAGGLVSSGPLLILTRFVKGLAAAFTAPTGLSLITTNFAEGPARNKALSIYTVFGAGGYSSGLLFGGLMTGVGWRWTFLLPVPIALAALASAFVLLPRTEPAAEGGHDLLGAAFSTAAMLLLVYTVVSRTQVGWSSARTIGSFVLVGGLVAAFVLVESRVKHPLIRLGILRKPTLVRASLAIVAVAGSYFSWQFIVTLYLQDSLGWSPLKLALALLPVGLMVAASSVFSDKLVDRFGTARIIAVTHDRDGGRLPAVPPAGHGAVVPTMILPAVLLIGVGLDRLPRDQHPGDHRDRRRRAGAGGRRAADLDAGRRRDRARRHHRADRARRPRTDLSRRRAERLPARARLRCRGVPGRRRGGGLRPLLPPGQPVGGATRASTSGRARVRLDRRLRARRPSRSGRGSRRVPAASV